MASEQSEQDTCRGVNRDSRYTICSFLNLVLVHTKNTRNEVTHLVMGTIFLDTLLFLSSIIMSQCLLVESKSEDPALDTGFWDYFFMWYTRAFFANYPL